MNHNAVSTTSKNTLSKPEEDEIDISLIVNGGYGSRLKDKMQVQREKIDMFRTKLEEL